MIDGAASFGSGVRGAQYTGSSSSTSGTSAQANSGPQDANSAELANFAAGLQNRTQNSGGVYA